MIQNSQQLLYPSELSKYMKSEVSGLNMDKQVRKYFIYQNSLFYQKDGNLEILKLDKSNAARQRTINFGGQMSDIFMTDKDSIYYKDKNHFANFANLSILKTFNAKQASVPIFNCRGAFVKKICYGMFNNRLALFTSPFEVTVFPALDSCRIDLMGSLDFEHMFVAHKEMGNKIVALARPNVI